MIASLRAVTLRAFSANLFVDAWNFKPGQTINDTQKASQQGQLSMRDLNFAWSNRSPAAAWAPLLLRLVVGYGFVQHGVAKLLKGPDAFAAILQTIGVPSPHFMAWLTLLTELVGGVAVFLGAFVTLVSFPLAVVLLVAIFTVHLPYGFSSIKLIGITAAGARFGPVGYETNLLYLACLASLALAGSGPFAVDGLLKRRSKHTSGPSR